jgi:purine nucleoside phosphorylase
VKESTRRQYAIIAGSGFGGFGDGSVERAVTTRFGKPSAPLRELSYGDHTVFTSLVVNLAAGRREASIHDAIEASTQTAKMQAFKVLKQFFSGQA